jgi:hypothetical protein
LLELEDELRLGNGAIGKNQIAKSTAKLLVWLESWRTKNGAYNGYVVHRLNLKRMLLIHDTPWSQAPIINSFLNLYQRTTNKVWLEKAIETGNLQVRRLTATGKYNYAGHEDDRFSGLVHNALANCALLDLAQALIEEDSSEHERLAEKYIQTVRINTEKYLIAKLWVRRKGAFKVDEKDYYSPKEDRFIANMNSVAVENLIKLDNITGKRKYLEFASRVGEWLLSLQHHSSNNLLNGAIAYQDNEPMTFISIYTALALRGMDDLFHLTRDKRYYESIVSAARHLLYFRDPGSGLFYHAYQEKSLRKFPMFVAGAGIILKALDDVNKLSGQPLDITNTLCNILSMQLPNGGFPSFVGYNSPGNNRRNGNYSIVWEDIVPTIGWNAHLLEFLTRFVPNDFCIPDDLQIETFFNKSKNHIYFETPKATLISGWNPFQSAVFYIVPNKKVPIGVNLLDVRAFVKFVLDIYRRIYGLKVKVR